MGRHVKQGLDSYPHDVDMSGDNKIALVEASTGIVGYAVIHKLFEKIYAGNGYYALMNDSQLRLFAKYCGLAVNVCRNIIETCIDEQLFSKEIFENYRVLTSRGIQKRFIAVAKRRKEIYIHKELILVDINKIDVNINLISDNINQVNKPKKSKPKTDKKKGNAYTENARIILAYLNEKTGKNYSDVSLIIPRLKEGHTIEECKTIIDNKSQDPFFIEKPDLMNPRTLFRPTHWDTYLNYVPDPRGISGTTKKNIKSLEDWRAPE